MAHVNFTPELAAEYDRLFATVELRDLKTVAATSKRVVDGQERYAPVTKQFGNMPWIFVGLIHLMEGDLNFKTHLHNGDPLSARTVHIPRGRPAKGNPPFAWGESAADAIRYDELDKWKDWSVAGILYALERYNGFGPRVYHHCPSAYLWAGSKHYSKGKYVADNQWDANAVSSQIGAGVILFSLCTSGAVALPATAA